ncbi:MAG TPA: L,D-transpeptidase family protein [Vicinamibacterales bacterium]|nr:L,D-transpeptidase family protein [Vicinamibacterales bacterium]
MRRSPFFLSLCAVAVAAAWAHWPLLPLPDGAIADRIFVDKSERRLDLYDGAQLLRSYSVSLGREPVGPKRREGDQRTPEGRYVIDYHKPDSAYHRALHISYPRPDQVAAARARGEPPGSLIMIHGLSDRRALIGKFNRLEDWTIGCIAVTNAEVEELWRVVPDGTPIEIRP